MIEIEPSAAAAAAAAADALGEQALVMIAHLRGEGQSAFRSVGISVSVIIQTALDYPEWGVGIGRLIRGPVGNDPELQELEQESAQYLMLHVPVSFTQGEDDQ